MKEAKVRGKRQRIKWVGRGSQKWGAWETRGEDCCRWVEPEQVQNRKNLEARSREER